jgi:NhaA family Na+:H+ antiporter
LERACERVETPLQRLEHTLHPWVGFVIMPVFALANAGVTVGGELRPLLGDRVTLGVVLGLVVGKQVGIMLFSRLAVRSGVAELPQGVTWRQVFGLSWLAGIGFTMSLFIAGLAFGGTPLLAAAKVGIVAASLLAGVGGWLILRGSGQGAPPS